MATERKDVIVRLTRAEASALEHAAGNVMNYPDAQRASFPSYPRRAAAVRAYEKLSKAWRTR